MKNSRHIIFIAKKLTKKYYINKNKKKIINIITNAQNYSVDPKIIIGIFLIETYFRPWYERILEYCFFTIEWLLNLFIKKPIRNYTLGHFQIGITTILFYRNITKCKIHDRNINKMFFHQFICIIANCKFERNLFVCCTSIHSITCNVEKKWGKVQGNVGRIGEIYNGKISYGALLLELHKMIELSDESNILNNNVENM